MHKQVNGIRVKMSDVEQSRRKKEMAEGREEEQKERDDTSARKKKLIATAKRLCEVMGDDDLNFYKDLLMRIG